jgi:hypothetical protein
VFDDAIFDLFHIYDPAQSSRHRCHTSARNAAGNDQIKMVELGVDVECEAVTRDPSRDAHPNGRDLLVAHPDAGQPFDAAGIDTVIGGRANEDRFEIAHVTVNVATVGVQVDDRIADNLPGPVIGDIAPATGLVNVDAARGEGVGGRKNVRAAAVAAHAERQDVGMFEEEQRVADSASTAIFDEHTLQSERLGVRHSSEPTDVKKACRLSCPRFLPVLLIPPHLPIPPFQPILPRQIWFGSQFSSDFFTIDMNSSATAPSMTR